MAFEGHIQAVWTGSYTHCKSVRQGGVDDTRAEFQGPSNHQHGK